MELSSTPMLIALLALAIIQGVAATYRLEPLSTTYIPYMYIDDEGYYDIDAAAVEQSAYDEVEMILYAAGDKYIHILDLSNPANPSIIDKFSLDHRANDIEICGSYVAYVTEGATPQDDGFLIVRGLYDRRFNSWRIYHNIKVGSKPDMLKFSHDCSFIITANEGEAAESPDKSTFVNPEGSVSIVRKLDGFFPEVKTLDFTSFNELASHYESMGVRAPYKGQLNGDVYNTFSQNMEPEYIAISHNDKRAYICLQENNAIAVLDITANKIDEILPLGRKDWSSLGLDASDKDGKIVSNAYNIFSFYQPDAIKMYTFNGQDYLLTANEGDKFDYTLGNDDWDDVKRGESLHDDGDLSNSISNSLADEMNDDDKLGRLQFSKFDGLDSDGKVREPHFFGARGVSIFKPAPETMELVWDSGDEVEQKIAQYYPHVFNGDTKPDEKTKETPEDLKDSRSDNLGPECESIEIGNINGEDYAFFGVDRSAAILIYHIDTTDSEPQLSFESVFRAGGTSKTYQELLDDRNLGDLDPEDLKFIPADVSATGNPLLLVTSTVSGTVSVYQIVNN